MKMHARFYFAVLLALTLLFNSACGKKSDLTLPEEPTENIEKTE